jgi:hypothetical protein
VAVRIALSRLHASCARRSRTSRAKALRRVLINVHWMTRKVRCSPNRDQIFCSAANDAMCHSRPTNRQQSVAELNNFGDNVVACSAFIRCACRGAACLVRFAQATSACRISGISDVRRPATVKLNLKSTSRPPRGTRPNTGKALAPVPRVLGSKRSSLMVGARTFGKVTCNDASDNQLAGDRIRLFSCLFAFCCHTEGLVPFRA